MEQQQLWEDNAINQREETNMLCPKCQHWTLLDFSNEYFQIKSSKNSSRIFIASITQCLLFLENRFN